MWRFGMIAIAGLGIALVDGPHGSVATAAAPRDTASEPEATPAPARIEAVIVVTEDVDAAATIEALGLRAPQRDVQPQGRARPRVELFAVAEIRMKDAHTVALAVILSDFRAYYRDVEASAEDAPRIAASALANLLAGIEEERVIADAEDVPLPVGAMVEDPPTPAPTSTPTPAPAPTPTVRPELLVGLEGGGLLAIPPPSPAGFAAAGVGLGVGVRWPSGLFGGVAVRAAGRGVRGLGVVRTRGSLHVGLAWRRRGFELLATAGPDVEPVVVREGGARQMLTDPDGDTRRAALLLGGHLRVAPAFRHAFTSGWALRVGPHVEVAGSGLSSGGVARFVTGDPLVREAVLRAGGLEVAVGVELGVWIPIGNRASARPRPGARAGDPTASRR